MKLSHLLPAALLALAPSLAAQTTHDVFLFNTEFAPENVTIQVGDTVRWLWVGGFHNVVSGVGGAADGSFSSGNPSISAPPFSVTFDAAFLAANPMPGNVYDYYCVVHLPGMTGTVTVETGAVGSFQPYGSGLNPDGSFFAGGFPAVGQTAEFTLFDPLSSATGPGFGFLFVSTQPAPGFPSGIPIPGFNLAQGQPGELLLSTLPPNPVISLGPNAWAEGETVGFDVPIPTNPALSGLSVFVQGALVDPTLPEPIGLTAGTEMVIG
ncbi:MAG: plastocyanin/azurin family copper-binding protein [Planctomycetota bacterium]